MKKKIATIFLSLILAVVATGCGTYTPPSNNPDDPKPPIVGPDDPNKPDDGKNAVSSVQLIYNGEKYVLPDGAKIRAKWSDGISQPVYADFDANGRAETRGLDGDYAVTVEGLPSNRAYNPNFHISTNYERDIEIEIFGVTRTLTSSNNNGSEPLKGVILRSYGIYNATLQREGEVFYYIYEPTESGTFYVQSWVDITENAVNPKIDAYVGSKYYVGGYSTIDDGGPASTYTKNFLLEYNLNADEVNGSFVFGVKASALNAEYPLTITFRISRESDYVREDIPSVIQLPEEFSEVQNGNITRPEFMQQKQNLMTCGGQYNTLHLFQDEGVFDGGRIGFNETDGYYHMLDGDGKPQGPVVVAIISKSILSVFITEDSSDSFISIEYHGNKALTIDDNFDKFYKKTPPKYDDLDYHFINYKVFIEGYENIASHESDFPGISIQFAPYKDALGYKDMANDDGAYPVTRELYRFLQGYATNARLFMDGNGFGETAGLVSAEEDQWMFACGYYYNSNRYNP